MSLLPALQWRYATKVFDSEQKLSSEQVQELLEAANLTATSYGLQPFQVVLVENPELREQLLPHAYGQKQVTDASHLLVFATREIDEAYVDAYIARTAEARGSNPEALAGFKKMLMGIVNMSPEKQAIWAKNQAYIALGNVMTVAAGLGIDSCPMEGLNPAQFDAVLGLESLGLKTAVALPVGHRDNSDKYATSNKVRLSLEEFVIKL